MTRIFGELEMSILKMFKGQKRLTVREVLEALGESDKYTTVMTVMNRLVEKKELQRERHGQHYEYWMTSSSSGLLEKLKQKLFGGKWAPMVNYLIGSGNDITDQELDEMEDLIKEIRKTKRKS